MDRTVVIVATTAVLLIGGAAGVYFYFFTGNDNVTVSPTGNATLPGAGQATDSGSPGSNTISGGAVGEPIKVSSRLVQIDQGPIVPGEAISIVPAANASSSPDLGVHYIKRENGNVFLYRIKAGTLTRTSNKTVPGIQRAVWLPDASAAIVQFLSGTDFNTINTYRLSADGSNGAMMAGNIVEVQTGPSGILSLTSNANGSVGTISSLDGSKSSRAFSTPLGSIRTQIVGDTYLITTKASGTLPGNAFAVSTDGTVRHVFGPQKGLSALSSPSGKWLLVSHVDGPALRLELLNTATGAITQLPLSTLADKCVWTADESSAYCGVPVSINTTYLYPDDWYQGAAHFADRIWKIDVKGRYASLVLDFSKETKSDLDATALAVDVNDQNLVFLNKNDGSLWAYQL